MTNKVHILRCGRCKEPFSYVPSDNDKYAPGTPNQICDLCCELLMADEPEYATETVEGIVERGRVAARMEQPS